MIPESAVLRFDTEIGVLTLLQQEASLACFWFGPGSPPPDAPVLETALLATARRQIEEYLSGSRRDFELPLSAAGTPFQRAVWEALRRIPYGQTRTYAQIAAEVGSPRACRAVGMANNRNPLALFIPCHRVVGARGDLVGFAGGLSVKRHLLELERRSAVAPQIG